MRPLRAGLAILLPIALSAPLAAAPGDPPAPAYDKPLATRKTKSRKYETVCVYFPDFMLKSRTPLQGEGGAETPIVVRVKDAPCGEAKAAGETALKAADENATTAFAGRKGAFLIFEGSLEQNRDFAILDAASGRLLFKDTSGFGARIDAVSLDSGALSLRYRRDVTPSESCSLMANARACWARVAAEGKLPASAAKQTPSPQLCAAAYKAAGAQPSQESRLELPVEVRVDVALKAEVKANGPVVCEPF